MNKLINMQTKIDSSKPGGKCRKARLKCSLGLVERDFAKELSLYQLNLSPEKLKREKPKRYLQKKEPILLCLYICCKLKTSRGFRCPNLRAQAVVTVRSWPWY